MSDENANPTPPSPRKRTRKPKVIESTDSLLGDDLGSASESGAGPSAETAPVADLSASQPVEEPNASNPYQQPVVAPSASENAIGTLAEPGQADESAGGDPNSPADSALSSALEREERLASSIVNVAIHVSDRSDGAPVQSGEEYPGEHDPTEDPAVIPPNDATTETVSEPEISGDEPVDPDELQRVVEALLFAAMEPISVREIARAADSDSATIRKVLKDLKEMGDRERRPWDLVEVAGAYRFVTRAEFHSAILRLKTQTSQRKLTQAALETLALIAYRQPIGRAEIESIRGVNAGPVLRLLLEKKLVQISGRGTGIGQPLLYGTTDYFLENFGLKNVNELPKPGEFKNA